MKVASKLDSMPECVHQDFICSNYGDDVPEEILDRFGNCVWIYEELDVTLDVFDSPTRQRIEEREGGKRNPLKVPNDAARHAKQRELLKDGPSKEPIIVFLTPSGYELIEGWHRTIQSLVYWPDGYKQRAWVGYEVKGHH